MTSLGNTLKMSLNHFSTKELAMKTTRIQILLLALFTIAITGCLSKVDQVKEGKFLAYSTTTIGKAFDASFGNVEWTENTTSKGQDFVEFKGDVDIDFLELLAAAIVEDAGDDLANPYAASNTMDACLGKQFAQQYRKELFNIILSAAVGSLGLIALDGDLGNRIKEGAKAAFVSALANKSNRLTVQFDFTDSDDSDFELGYYGFQSEEWSDCNIQGLLIMTEFLDFVYSNHTYSKFDYKSIAKEIVDNAEAGNQLPDSLLKEKIAGYSKVKGALIANTVKKDTRVLKRRENAAKTAAEQKRLEEEEAKRKAEEEEEAKRKAEEEEEALRLAEEEKRQKAAMKEILPAMKAYAKKMETYKAECPSGCEEYPYWNVIGFKAPKSEYFDFSDGTELGGFDWQLGMDAKEDILGIKCHWTIRCLNTEKCVCNVSEDCKDISPNLKSLCSIEWDEY